ncbi:hypothetical protein AB0O68_09655 [Streptomyces sp. NPDC087512]|uniref:hypothetical protein n=1 Tax=Streptomyces sp. NPDC087512 TaxID=3155059 RepID=UPI0034138F81
MRLLHRLAPGVLALVCVIFLPYEAASHGRPPAGDTGPGRPFGAECLVRVDGSTVTAHCHNPYPEPDGVRLHVECVRWWDLDSDGPPAEAGPAQTVRLDGRCWKEVGAAWVSHQRVD